MGLDGRALWSKPSYNFVHLRDADVPARILGDGDDPALVRGEYLAMTTCNECHGMDLRGAWVESDIAPPDLAVIAGYSLDEFNTLMNEGRARDGRTDLGLMSMVAPDRFAWFTDGEREDLYRFLKTLIDRPVPKDVPWRPPR